MIYCTTLLKFTGAMRSTSCTLCEIWSESLKWFRLCAYDWIDCCKNWFSMKKNPTIETKSNLSLLERYYKLFSYFRSHSNHTIYNKNWCLWIPSYVCFESFSIEINRCEHLNYEISELKICCVILRLCQDLSVKVTCWSWYTRTVVWYAHLSLRVERLIMWAFEYRFKS